MVSSTTLPNMANAAQPQQYILPAGAQFVPVTAPSNKTLGQMQQQQPGNQFNAATPLPPTPAGGVQPYSSQQVNLPPGGRPESRRGGGDQSSETAWHRATAQDAASSGRGTNESSVSSDYQTQPQQQI